MRVLVDVTHPAHVHLFRPTIDALQAREHDVHVASRDKDVTVALLDAYGIEHTVISRKQNVRFGAPKEWVSRELRLLRLARRVDPNVILSQLNPAAAHVASLLSVPNLVFHDTEIAGFVERMTTPFSTYVCTPREYDDEIGDNHLRYEGFHELAYLHPARFDTDPTPLHEAGVDPDAAYTVLRLVGMDAYHDAGRSGFSPETIHTLIDGLSVHGDVYISSETRLPDELARYANPVPVHELHHLLAFANLYVGDSGTMATEAAILGTPAVRFNPLDRELGNFETLADYSLLISSMDEQTVADKAFRLIADTDAGTRWRQRRRSLLADKIDLTAFIVELTEEVGAA